MMNFPNSPADGDLSVQTNGVTYQWEDAKTRWNVVTNSGQDIVAGTVVQNKVVSVHALQSGSGVVPIDDTIPQFDEGDAIVGLEMNFTPKYANSLLVMRLIVPVVNTASQALMAAFVIQDGAGGAVMTGETSVPTLGNILNLVTTREIQAVSTDPRNYSVRIGSNTGNWSIFGTASTAYGGTESATLEITEIQPDAVTVPQVGIPGSVVQVQNFQTGELVTAVNSISWVDVIPVDTDGSEVMSIAFTPKFASSKLRIDAVAVMNPSTLAHCGMLLIQSGVTNTIGATQSLIETDRTMTLPVTAFVDAVNTDPRTFSVRIGVDGAGSCYLNGSVAARKYGGGYASSITVTEIAQ